MAGATVGACSAPGPASAPAANSFGSIVIDTVAVALNPQDPSVNAIGDFHYAGGLLLRASQIPQMHELSDFTVTDDARFAAVGDEGVLLEARLVLDDAGRLAGVADAKLSRLIGEDGQPLTGGSADAEGIALLPDGDLLISFERRPRIWLYPRSGGRPRAVPSPPAVFTENAGMEALAADPDAGGDAYVVGVEDSGDTWMCRVSAPCVKGPTVDKPAEFGLVAINRLPERATAYLLRAYDAVRRNRVTLQIVRDRAVIARLDIAAPMTVDNFEGMTSVVNAEGRRRFYLLSDDNNSASQRTLLLAFDWQPRAPALTKVRPSPSGAR